MGPTPAKKPAWCKIAGVGGGGGTGAAHDGSVNDEMRVRQPVAELAV